MKKVLSLALTLCMLISIFGAFSIGASAASTPSDWAVNEVNAAINEGLVTNKVTTDYQKSITREEFCELVVKLYENLTGEKAVAGNDSFSDTDNTEILKAYSLGIVKGVSETEFAPNNNITRQELCVMLVRAVEAILSDEFILKYDFYKFEDGKDIADWAFEQVHYAYEKGIIKGVGDNKINPLGTATCEQAIILMHRLYENIDKCKTFIPQEIIDRHENYTYVNETFKSIEKKYTDENGYVKPEDIENILEEIYASSLNLNDSGDIIGTTLNKEYLNICILLKDGSRYIYTPPIEGLASSNLDVTEFNNIGALDIKVFSYISNKIDNNIEVNSYKSYYNNELGINMIKHILNKVNPNNKHVMFWRGHGGVWDYQKQESIHDNMSDIVSSDSKASIFFVDNDSMLTSSFLYQDDINEGRVIYSNNGCAITPKFFEKYLHHVNGGLFCTGSCFGLADHYNTKTTETKMSEAFINKGFDTYIGSDISVYNIYSDPMLKSIGEYLCEYTDNNRYETITASEALQKAKDKHGATDGDVIEKIYEFFNDVDISSGAEFFLMGDPDFRLIESKTVQSAHIAEYNGTIYSTRKVPGMVEIPVKPAKYDYIWEIAFYGNRLYYSCKEGGSSDYRSAIYSCNIDGSDLRLLYDGTYESTSFTISNNKLYPSSSSNYFGKIYVDLENNAIKDLNHLKLNDYSTYYIDGNYMYCSTYNKKTKYNTYKANIITGEVETLASGLSGISIHIVSSEGDIYYIDGKNYLYRIGNKEHKLIHHFDKRLSIAAIIGDCVYYESYEGNISSLYYYNMKTSEDIFIDSHQSAGGGIYFNW